MKRTLVCIPCYANATITERAIISVVGSGADVYLWDNGAPQDVKDVIHRTMWANVVVGKSAVNLYVNEPWQLFIDYFLEHKEYERLVIMNSDLIMHADFLKVLDARHDNEKEVPLPVLLPSINQLMQKVEIEHKEGTVVHSGTPGVFMVLTRQQAAAISPIPYEHIKVWFGDNWIYEILRETGHQTVIVPNLYAHHYESVSVRAVPGISEIIEADKVAWAGVCQELKKQKIETYFE